MTAHAPAADLTDDRFLDGRIALLQPRSGYRIATDPVFLAASCAPAPGARVLDVGCGVGAAALLLGARRPGLDLTGLEVQPDLAALSDRNAARAGLRWRAALGDLRDAARLLDGAAYDLVLTNPPYRTAEEGPACAAPGRDLANRETMPLAEWIDLCLRRLAPGGRLHLVHRADRLGDILSALGGRVGAVVVHPLWARAGAPARRVIVRAEKGARAPLRLTAGLVLHDGPPGVGAAPFTAEAQAILTGAAALDLDAG